jgi:hypothetical protein
LYSDLAWRKRKWERDLRDRVESVDHLVDIGVEMHTVVHDPKGKTLLPGKPPLRILRTKRAGGILDTEIGRIVAPSQNRVTWFCSEDQEPIILHADALPLGLHVFGSEGAGKTTVLPKWNYFRWLEHLGEGREGGFVAPTKKRLRMFLKELRAAYPATWFRYIKSEELVILADQTRLQLVSAHQQSKDEGSPVQGYSWSWALGDEDQDMVDRHEDIEARGRAAKSVGGVVRYKQVRTCTPKDDSAFRAHKDKLDASGHWTRLTMLGRRSPFIGESHWDRMLRSMSLREYQRRVLAMDVGPELAVYYGWDRTRNLTARPQIATDVTAAILAGYQSYTRPGAEMVLSVCHDPGVIFNTSLVKRLVMFDQVPTWMVVGEMQTKQTTARQHALSLRTYLQNTFDIERGTEVRGVWRPDPDSAKAAIFVDPHGRGETETDYDTVYGAMQATGLDVFSPSRKRIKRAARVGMVNRLLAPAAGPPRLVVACDHQKQPAAPVLVDALENLQKRAGDDDPEGSQRKDVDDKTHAPAALGYGLWPFEQESLTSETVRRAITAARRVNV